MDPLWLIRQGRRFGVALLWGSPEEARDRIGLSIF